MQPSDTDKQGAESMKWNALIVIGATLGAAIPDYAAAQNAPALINQDAGVPVFPYDIKDRPYQIVGTVHAGVRKATIFSKEASQAKIYRELWERAQKLGADAVINATYGDAHITAFSWGKTNATGTAVKFVQESPAASQPNEAAVGQTLGSVADPTSSQPPK